MLFWQILIDGFAISSLYALGATGFTLIFGVTGVLNLSHGAIMVAAAVAAWAASGNFGAGAYLGAVFGVVVALLLALATYYLIVRRLKLSRAGVISDVEIVDQARFVNDKLFRNMALSARDAALLASPISLPPGRYDAVMNIAITLDPRAVLR